MMIEVAQEVRVRKYDVDIINLQKLLREAKKQSKMTNKELATALDVPLTKVEHWFRVDNYFAIPDEDLWFDLKELLHITDNSFDASIITFEVKDGVYEKSNRCYYEEGIAPTLTCACGDEKIIVKAFCIIDDLYANRDIRVYNDYSPSLRAERFGLLVAEENILN